MNVVKVGNRPGLATIVMITNKIDGLSLTEDLPLQRWKEASFLHPSIARPSKMASVHHRLIERRIGRLRPPNLDRILCDRFGFWIR